MLVSYQWIVKSFLLIIIFDFAGATGTRSRQSTFGRGTGPIALNQADCDGSEVRLIDCPRMAAPCYEHAGVYCPRRTGRNAAYTTAP